MKDLIISLSLFAIFLTGAGFSHPCLAKESLSFHARQMKSACSQEAHVILHQALLEQSSHEGQKRRHRKSIPPGLVKRAQAACIDKLEHQFSKDEGDPEYDTEMEGDVAVGVSCDAYGHPPRSYPPYDVESLPPLLALQAKAVCLHSLCTIPFEPLFYDEINGDSWEAGGERWITDRAYGSVDCQYDHGKISYSALKVEVIEGDEKECERVGTCVPRRWDDHAWNNLLSSIFL